MLSSYLKVFLRTLARQKVFSFINITGLAIGVTCFIVLSLVVLDEAGYDKYNENADQIYRVLTHTRINGQESTSSKTAIPLGETLKKDFPEVVSYSRLDYFGQHNFRYGDKVFREYDIYKVDSAYFSIFTLPFVYGNPKTALNNPNSIVLTETSAKKYFGNENPVGKALTVDERKTLLITGVMKDFPRKSHFSCSFLVSMSTDPTAKSQNWLDSRCTTFILLQKGTNEGEFNNKMKSIVANYVGPQATALLGFSISEFYNRGNQYNFILQPLSSIYLYSQAKYNVDLNSEWGDVSQSSITFSYILLAIGTFILLIAVFNFMNLATAKSEKRSREVGIRKTLGSDKKMLIAQFISEAIFTSLLSVILSIGLTKLVLPYFNEFVDRDLSLDLTGNFYTIPALIAFALIVGLLSGSYPAFYLSSFETSQVLKGNLGKKSRKSRMRSLLIVLQFAISITLIIGTVVIKDQLRFIQNKDLGFNKEHLVTIVNGSVIRKQIKSFQDEISRKTGVVSSTAASVMFSTGMPGNGYMYDRMSGTNMISAQYLNVDYDFMKTYQLEVKKGRFFSKEFGSDSNAVVVNEEMARRFTDKEPIGKNLGMVHPETKTIIPFRIIGIVKDFNYESLHQKVRPLVLYLSPVKQEAIVITMRIKPGNINKTISSIEDVWKTFAGNEKIRIRFMDENLARMYRAEERMGTITTVFSLLAIIVACLGLFGLVSFVTEQRTKEIGVRKVLGASVFEIVLLISKDFLKLVLLANLISWPVAYYIMRNWLNNFAYRIEIGWTIFGLSALIALLIALATISYQVIKVALQNPVNSLRYE